MQSVFLDFLDHSTADHRALANRLADRDRRFRYSILAAPKATFYFATPAVAKCDDTTHLLAQYGELWRHGRIRYVLDAKHLGAPRKYFLSRLSKLESALDDCDLANHFEYSGYKSNGWSVLFEQYLPSVLEGRTVHAEKVLDGDLAFRSTASKLLGSDTFIETLRDNGSWSGESIALRIELMAKDTDQLFQRDHISSVLLEEKLLAGSRELAILHNSLDRAFAISNKETTGLPMSPLTVDAVDAGALRNVARNIKFGSGTLADALEQMSPLTVIELSYQSEWRIFIKCLAEELAQTGAFIQSQAHRLPPKLRRQLPSSHFSTLQRIGAMIVAYLIAPIFEGWSASRALSALFTDAPAWSMAGLNSLLNRELTNHIVSVTQKIPKLATFGAPRVLQPLSSFGLIFDTTNGYRHLARAP